MDISAIPRNLAPVPPKGTADEMKLGSKVHTSDDSPAHLVVVGCPDDLGVRHSMYGRPGASEGPPAIRHWLYRMGIGPASEMMKVTLRDFGDVLPGKDLEESHERVEKAVELCSGKSSMVILGGSGDFSYGSISGLLASNPGRVAILSIDAHLDCSPLRNGTLITHETAFRRLQERWDERIERLVALGVQEQNLSASHLRWAKDRGLRHRSLSELRNGKGVEANLLQELEDAATAADQIVLSLDLDAFAAAYAPGVSNPSADGFSPTDLLGFLETAGENPKVRMLEVMELSPEHDLDERTARLAALAIWRFVYGATRR